MYVFLYGAPYAFLPYFSLIGVRILVHAVTKPGSGAQGHQWSVYYKKNFCSGEFPTCLRKQIAQKKHGAWQVADSDQEAPFLRGQCPLLQKIAACFRAHRISAQKSGKQCVSPLFAQMQKLFAERIQRFYQKGGAAGHHSESGCRHKRKKRGNHCLIPQEKSVFGALKGELRIKQETHQKKDRKTRKQGFFHRHRNILYLYSVCGGGQEHEIFGKMDASGIVFFCSGVS